jgi:very-short-patch-repair endonuclease
MTHRRATTVAYDHSQALRHEQTEAEYRLWQRLRAHRMNGVHFRRQHAIGNYVVDFCAPRERIVIELDGSQHLDQEDYDKERTDYLEFKGYLVLRFWNDSITNDLDTVLCVILEALEEKKGNPHPPPITSTHLPSI